MIIMISSSVLDSLVYGGKGTGSEFLLKGISCNCDSLPLHLSIHVHVHVHGVSMLLLIVCHWIRIHIHFVVYWNGHDFLSMFVYMYFYNGVISCGGGMVFYDSGYNISTTSSVLWRFAC